MKKIPKIYLAEFLKEKALLIKKRTELATLLFIITFLAGSISGTLILNEEFTRTLITTWILVVCVSTLIFVISRKISTLRAVKLNVTFFMILCLGVIAHYYINNNEPPFNVAMTYIFTFLGFSLIFPWSPNEVIGVLLLHVTAYTVFLVNTGTYIYRNIAFTLDVPDYLQGFIMLFLSFFFCHVVTKRERLREVENFVLIKDIEKKNKQMQDELELATRVHSRLIPHSVNTHLADIAVTYVPMHYMGGDYAKFHFIDKNRLIFIICDVTGHGVSAALLVNALNSEFERLAKEGKSPGRLLNAMDKFITKDFAEVNMYMTAFCGLLDFSHFQRKFTYSSHGHPPQYVYRTTNSEIQKIPALTSFLGLPLEDENIYENQVSFKKDDNVLLFTDGVIEAKNKDQEEFGYLRLENFIKENNSLEVENFNQSLLDKLNSFSKNQLRDDVFILNIKTK